MDRVTGPGPWMERAAIVLLVSLYLMWFKTVIPSADALVYIRHLEQGLLVWNPNHLLMDPVAYFSSSLMGVLGVPVSAITLLKCVSGLSTVVALLLFHSVLLEIGVKAWMVRCAATLALFGSRNFLSMAVSEEFFILQMPLLMAVHLLCIRVLRQDIPSAGGFWPIGALMAVLVAFSIHNLFLLFGLGVYFGRFARAAGWRIGDAIRLWGGAAAIGFPLFVGAFFLSRVDAGFVSWLTAYQGSAENPLRDLYGVRLSLSSVVESAARVGFGMITNFADAGGVGTVLKSMLFSKALEFIPDRTRITVGALSLLVVAGFLLMVAYRLVHGGWRLPIVRLSIAWVMSYLAFNFFWSDSSDQFWMHILPVIWVSFLLMFGFVGRNLIGGAYSYPGSFIVWRAVLVMAALLLLLSNTWQMVVPLAFIDLEKHAAERREILRPGDLEIIPGWDAVGWLSMDGGGLGVEQISLMELGLKGRDDDAGMASLPTRVGEHLESGRRVLVARLYDLDQTPNPWYGLAQLGWPRARIQNLLSGYCTREVARIGDVVFREIHVCDAGFEHH